MYRFQLNGTSIECETASELHAAIYNGHVARRVADSRVAPRRRIVRKPSKPAVSKTKNAWTEAREEAVRQGRSDVAVVRSEMAAAKLRAAK